MVQIALPSSVTLPDPSTARASKQLECDTNSKIASNEALKVMSMGTKVLYDVVHV